MALQTNISSSQNWFTDEDKVWAWTVYQSDGVTAQDISSFTFRYEIRTSQYTVIPLVSKTLGNGITLVSGPGGTLSVAIPRTDTLSWSGGTYWHELLRTNGGVQTAEAFGTVYLHKGSST